MVTQNLVRYLIDVDSGNGKSVTLPCADGKVHPLIGVYSKSLHGDFKKALDSRQLKLMRVIENFHLDLIRQEDLMEKGFSTKIFANINTQMTSIASRSFFYMSDLQYHSRILIAPSIDICETTIVYRVRRGKESVICKR